jgi:3-deoxy-D-manno-octulosonic-acid transferase
MLSSVYRIATDLGAPFVELYLFKRRMEGREDPARFPERMGHASRVRPSGRLIWCHAASVGEAVSVLVLIERIRELYPDTNLLVTSGTVTSARMLEKRLSQGVIHQYMPVDRMPYVERFLSHWRPDFAMLIESEIWPNMLFALRERNIPAALVNGRMSDRSFRRWYRFQGWARELMSTFAMCIAQTEDDRARFVALGARPARCFGNLKYTAKPLPFDEAELVRLRLDIGERPVWLFASSHRGEEEAVCAVHKKLREKFPDLLTIIVPRHATRGDEIARLIAGERLVCARRSLKESPAVRTDIYLADTMGELGLFYRLSPVAVIGGSFVTIGGHNPIEAAQLDCAVVFGPHMYNFSSVAREFVNKSAAIQLQGSNELAFTIERLLASGGERAQYTAAARALADQKRHVLDEVLQALTPWIDSNPEDKPRQPYSGWDPSRPVRPDSREKVS